MKFPMGVFLVKNTFYGKIYIGSSNNLNMIRNSNKFHLVLADIKIPNCSEDWKKYGAENFTFEILHELKLSDDPSVDARSELKRLKS